MVVVNLNQSVILSVKMNLLRNNRELQFGASKLWQNLRQVKQLPLPASPSNIPSSLYEVSFLLIFTLERYMDSEKGILKQTKINFFI